MSRVKLGPKWLVPPVVLVTSPTGIYDVLGRKDALAERCDVHEEVRHLAGDSLFVLPTEQWLPRKRALQPVFTKRNVRSFGGHMSKAAEALCESWPESGEVDLDADCRRLTMRSLGRSVLGLDLNEHADAIAEHMHVASSYTPDRALRPVRAPRWLPTPARARARAAVAAMRRVTDDILQVCRADPTRDAPLVHALIAATDPETGRSISDEDIGNDLLIFVLAGHDTTATALTYALWALGHHRDIQDRVAADGYRVEAGSFVAIGIYAVHRDPALWDDALVFNPDRFSPEASGGRDRRQFVPFAGGPRSCIGEHFAVLETTLALATVIRSTEIRSVDDEFPVEVPFTTVAKGPIPARVETRR